jgi:tetratricopeptide (TPR) repeat protein
VQTSPTKQKAHQCFQKGQYRKARDLYERALKQNSNDPETLYMLGSIHGQNGQYERAVEYFQRTLKLQPGAVVAWCGLGAALKQLRCYPEAEHAFRKAVSLKPGFADAKLELAGTLLHQQKRDEAKQILQKIAGQNPLCAEAFHGLGEIAHAQRSLDDAIRYYDRAVEIAPDRAVSHNRIGTALHHKGQIDDAVAHFQTAVSLQPDFAEAFKNMGSALMSAGRLQEAKTCFDKATALRPDYVDAIIGKASVLERQGRAPEAYEVIRPFLEKGIEHPGIGIILSEICGEVNKCDEATDYLERLIAVPDLSDPTREQMYYALGKLLDKLKHYDPAFDQFRKANDLRPVKSLPAEHSAVISAIMETFGWTFLSAVPRASIESDRPLFIVGMPRSGTSLTEQILASHPDIVGAGELVDIGNYAAELPVRLGGNLGFPQCFRNISQQDLNSYAVKYLQRLEQVSDTARVVTDKMPQNFIHLGLIALLFPKSRIIHCRRDPIDTCLSIYFQHFNEAHEYATRLEHIAHYYLDYRRLMDHWKSVLDLPILDVEYQEMVTNLEPVTRRMLEFVDAEWNSACLNFHKSDRFVSTSSYDQVRQPIYTSSVCRWRNYEKHIEPLKEILAPLYRQ